MAIARLSPAGPAFGHVGASSSLRGSMPVRSAAREWRLGRGPTLAGAGRKHVDGQGERRRGEGGLWGGPRGKRGGRGGGGGGPETGLGAGAGGPGRRAVAALPCPAPPASRPTPLSPLTPRLPVLGGAGPELATGVPWHPWREEGRIRWGPHGWRLQSTYHEGGVSPTDIIPMFIKGEHVLARNTFT